MLEVFVVWKKQISSTHSHPYGRREWTTAKNHRETIMFAFLLNASAAAERRFLANESLNIYFSFSFPLWITTTQHDYGMGAIEDQNVRMRTWTNTLPFYYVWLSIVWSTLGGLYSFHINFATFLFSSSSSVVIVAPLFALSFVHVSSRFYFFLIECSCCCCCVLRTYINIDANNRGVSEQHDSYTLNSTIRFSSKATLRHWPWNLKKSGDWIEMLPKPYSRSRESPKYHHFNHCSSNDCCGLFSLRPLHTNRFCEAGWTPFIPSKKTMKTNVCNANAIHCLLAASSQHNERQRLYAYFMQCSRV